MGNSVGVDLGGHIVRIAVRVTEDELHNCPIPGDRAPSQKEVPTTCQSQVATAESHEGSYYSFLSGDRRSSLEPSEKAPDSLPGENPDELGSSPEMKLVLGPHTDDDGMSYLGSSDVVGGEIRFVDFALSSADSFLSSEAGKWLLSKAVRRPLGGSTFPRPPQENRLATKVSFHEETKEHSHPRKPRPPLIAFPAIGSGAWRLEEAIRAKCGGMQLERHREATCILAGMEYVLRHVPKEVFTYECGSLGVTLAGPLPSDRDCEAKKKFLGPHDFNPSCGEARYPYILVNIKSGLAFHRVDSPHSVTRVGGSSIGGSTIMGLARAMLQEENSRTPVDVISCAKKSERERSPLDLLVKDIYGGDYSSIGLSGDVVASCFGKADSFRPGQDGEEEEEEMDGDVMVARSLIDLMAINTAQLAFLQAKLHGCLRVVFAGVVVEAHLQQVFAKIQSSFDFWSQGTVQGVFFSHAHYLGCLGALLKREQAVAATPGRHLQPSDSTTLDQALVDEQITTFQVKDSPQGRRRP